MRDGLDYGLSDGFAPAVAPEEEETDVLTIVTGIIVRAGGQSADVRDEHSAEDYISLIYADHEFARIPMTPEVSWIEFFMTPAMKQKYEVDGRFENVENKNQNYWRVYLGRPEDVNRYEDIIVEGTL